MKPPKGMISITELARHRNTTTETLRHYDRIGLYKPDWINPENGYRYYSVSYWDERLGTILELKALGMPLEDIRDFLTKRNVKKSLQILKKQQKELDERINTLLALKASIGKVIDTTETALEYHSVDTPYIAEWNKCRYIISRHCAYTPNEINLDTFRLETNLSKTHPFIVSASFGALKKFEHDQFQNGYYSIINVDNPCEGYENVTIPAGYYACINYTGDHLDVLAEPDQKKENLFGEDEMLRKLKEYVDDQGYSICGDMLLLFTIDMALTDIKEEILLQMRIPVKKKAAR